MTDETDDRIIRRWARAPGYDGLLDRAEALVRADLARPGHHHHVIARSKNGRIDFEASPWPPFDHLCRELDIALEAIEDESTVTCEMCGAPGEERQSHPYRTLCARHAAALRP